MNIHTDGHKLCMFDVLELHPIGFDEGVMVKNKVSSGPMCLSIKESFI